MLLLVPASTLALALLAPSVPAGPAPAVPAPTLAAPSELAAVAPAAFAHVDAALIPGDARWLAHVDLDALLASATFSTLQGLDVELDFDNNPDVREVRSMLGFDPLKELHSVTAYGNARDDEAVVVMVRGSAQLEKVFGLLDQHLDRSEHDVDGVVLTRWDEPGTHGDPVYTYMASKSGSDERLVLLSGHPADLADGVNALRGDGETLADHPGALDVSADPGAFLFVSASGKLAQLSGDETVDEFGRLVEKARVQVGEHEGALFVDVRVTTRNPADAVLATQILQGGLAIAGLAARNEPELQQVMPLLDKLRFGAQGAQLNVHFEEDIDALVALIQKLDGGHDDWEQAVDEYTHKPAKSKKGKKADGWY